MYVTLTLELDPALLAQLLAVRQARGRRVAASAPSLPEAASIRMLLTSYGLTPRQCDLVLLDVQGYTRTDIAAYCGITPATVKKYWNAIYVTLGIPRRQALRAWLLAQLHAREGVSETEAVSVPNDLPMGDWFAAEPAAMLETSSTAHGSDCQE